VVSDAGLSSQCRSIGLSSPLRMIMSAMFCASETSRGVKSRTSAIGLNLEELASSTGANLKQTCPQADRNPAVFAQFSPLMS